MNAYILAEFMLMLAGGLIGIGLFIGVAGVLIYALILRETTHDHIPRQSISLAATSTGGGSPEVRLRDRREPPTRAKYHPRRTGSTLPRDDR